MYSMKKLVLPSIIASFFSITTWADEYQSELSILYSEAENNSGYNDTDASSVFLGTDIYFEPVNVGSSAYGEAAFLDKASKVSFNHSRLDVSSYMQDRETIETALSTDIVIEGKVILHFGLEHEKNKSHGTYAASGGLSKNTHQSLGFGLYFTDNFSGMLKYTMLDDSFEINANLHAVFSLNSQMSLALDLDVQRNDLDNYQGDNQYFETTASATFYPIQSLGIGISHYNNEGGFDSDNFYSDAVFVEYFPVSSLSLNAAYSTSDSVDTGLLGLTFRF